MVDMRQLPLGRRLGSGGEGAVFEITGRPKDVAKIYHTPLSGLAAEKLEAMVAMDPGPLAPQAAWPRELIRDRSKLISGFIMDRATEPFDVHEVYSPRDRLQNLPAADWTFLVRVAQNISIAFAAAHSRGIVIGDVNHGSVRVAKDGRVRLIDCDSMQVTAGGKVLRCNVGVDTYTPPELQDLRLSEIDRTPDHDAFGLAVLIFHLLFLGRHPFAGVPLQKSAPSDIAGAIKSGAYAYTAAPKLLRPPPKAPGPDIVTPRVRELFEAAFAAPGRGNPPTRPDARDWHEGLGELAGSLRACSLNRAHHFSAAAGKCPWCVSESRGMVFFYRADPQGIALLTRIDPARMKRVCARIYETSGQLHALASWQPASQVPPPRPRAVARAIKPLAQVLAPLLCVASVALAFIVNWWFLGALVGIGLAAMVSLLLLSGRLDAEIKKSKARLWKIGGALPQQEQTQLRSLLSRERVLRANAETLAQHLDDMAKRPFHQLHWLHLKMHLERIRIRPGQIEGVGASRVAQLQSFGIETAADISAQTVRQVPGFGPSFTNRVVSWRRGCEKQFRFDPAKANDPRVLAGMQAQRRAMVGDHAKIVGELETLLQRLEVMKNAAEARKAAIEPQILQAKRSIAQAEADKAFFKW